MRRIYITGALFRNALQFVDSAKKSHDDGWVDAEVQHSLGAHLMCALALEGIINEVGEIVLSAWVWKRTEKIDTSLKWLVVSQFLGGSPFVQDKEPLQSVADLQLQRNRIVHPKSLSPGDEVIVRNQDGRVIRDVQGDDVPEDGATIFLGLGKLLVEFNFSSAQKAAIRTHAAMRALKEKVTGNQFNWVMDLESEYPWLTGN